MLLLKRSPSQIRFAQILRQTYVDMWKKTSTKNKQQRGKDQPALDAAALRFGEVAALPTTFNLKPEHCDKGHLVRGAVRILHWKDVDVPRAVAICRVVNANVTARLVVGLSMCGLRGDDVVRVKRLKPPWINATAANTPPRRALASAPHVASAHEPPAKRRQTRRRAADAARARTPTQDHDPSRDT